MKEIEITRTIYPRLPDIPDEETLILITTLESEERAFATEAKEPYHQYLKILYLKAMSYLGHSRFNPGDLPRRMRLELLRELNLSKELADILAISPVDKSRIVAEVRRFLGLKPYTAAARTEVETWLKEKVAHKEGDLLAVINAAITWFRDRAVELPPFTALTSAAEAALKAADEGIQDRIGSLITREIAEKLDSLLEDHDGRTTLDRFKDEVSAPSSIKIQAELERLKTLKEYALDSPVLKTLSRHKVEHFAELCRRYHASELKQLKEVRRRTILLCYVLVRRSQLLDAVAEVFIHIWINIKAAASRHATTYRQIRAASQEKHEKVLEDLLDFICDSPSDSDLIRKIRRYRTIEEYEQIRQEVKKGISYSECYHRKMKDHYTTLRRFLPQWYELIPLVSTTSDDSVLKGIEFLQEHGDPRETTLPVLDVPVDFLSCEWERRAVVRHMWNGSITVVHKAAYELGLVDAVVRGLQNATLAIEGARRYAPMTDHLINKEEFFASYPEHLTKLGYPEKAQDYYAPLREELKELLKEFDEKHDDFKKIFRVNHKGSLSYCRNPSEKPPRRIERLSQKLQASLTPVTILDVLLDCHKITGFLDCFRPLMGRQNMTEEERIQGLIATLYAYGCNSGPSQAAQATGLRRQAIVYLMRHYMGIRQLMDAASALVDAYGQTTMSRRLREPGIFMTDSMRFPTLTDSLTARHHFRYGGGRSILLYQHVTTCCICFFTKALLCDVSEAIHMIGGVVNQKSRFNPTINICDNAGRSDFITGLARMLNIDIWPRLTSRQNFKLWIPDKDVSYTHINSAIAGPIHWDLIDAGWKDMIWIIASIGAGKADPFLVAEHLNSQPRHPATLGFKELGKLIRTIYMLHYGMDMSLRRTVIRYTARRETWNSFGRNVFHGFGGTVKQKDSEKQNEVFWFLTVVQNAIVLWNALALEQAIEKSKNKEFKIEDEDLKHMLPVMVEHINFVGRFDFDLNRQPPFRLSA